jgi:outer membrane protein OmpA-like peptidoglycan-associated protein
MRSPATPKAMPSPVPTGRRSMQAFAASAMTALAIALAFSAPAASPLLAQQSYPPPSRLGASDASGPIPAARADAIDREKSDRVAAVLLQTARKDRAAGNPDLAQRVLERLIAQYPETAAARDARRELFELYAGNEQINAAPAPPARSSPGEAASAQSPGAAPAAAPTAASPWRTSVTSFRRLQDEFRNATGDRVFFPAGSAELAGRARTVLTAQAAWLAERPQIEATVEGHADDAPAGADNDKMAQARALAVRDLLVAAGVAPNRLKTLSQGNRDPIAICDTADCAAQNRRVVVHIGLMQTGGRGNSGTPDAPAEFFQAPIR